MLREGWEASSFTTTLAAASVTKGMPSAIADIFDIAIESCSARKAFLLTVQNLSRATSGPEQLSSDCPRPQLRRQNARSDQAQCVHGGPEGEFTEALTDNFQKLYLRGRHEANRWITAHMGEVEEGALAGIID